MTLGCQKASDNKDQRVEGEKYVFGIRHGQSLSELSVAEYTSINEMPDIQNLLINLAENNIAKLETPPKKNSLYGGYYVQYSPDKKVCNVFSTKQMPPIKFESNESYKEADSKMYYETLEVIYGGSNADSSGYSRVGTSRIIKDVFNNLGQKDLPRVFLKREFREDNFTRALAFYEFPNSYNCIRGVTLNSDGL